MFVRSLTLGVAAAALLAGGAQAADLIIPTTPQPIYEAAGFNWEGLYVGARLGGEFVGDNAIGTGVASSTLGVVGAAVGVNFLPADPLLIGAEVTADYLWNGDYATGEFFANLRAGAVVTDNVLVYALGGIGTQTRNGTNTGLYQLGGGLEVGVTDAVSVRAELVGVGDFAAGGNFFDGAKATVGVFYHF